ncbi:MAG: restriction endonuclease subunit S, partial [Acetobacter sp.]|nr:restriction endonuclease subunit S [Acetobacter sp.]
MNNTAMNATLEKDPYAPLNNALDISPELAEFAQFVPLNQCLDFKTAAFNKVINLSLITTSFEEKASLFENSRYKLVKLKDVVKFGRGSSKYTKNIYKEDGQFDAYSGAGCDGKVDFYENDCEAVIISSVGARCGKCFYATGKWTAINNTMVMYANEDKILNKFLYLLTNNEEFWPRSGSAQPFIRPSDAENQKIPLPPLEIQQQIVNACEEVKAQNHALDRAIADQHDTISAILSYTKITDADIHQNFNQENTALFHSLPTPETYGLSEWEKINVDHVCKNIFAGGDAPKHVFSEKKEGFTVPIFSNGATNNGLYGYTDIARVTTPAVTVSARGTIGFSAIRTEPFPIVRLIT